MYSFSSASQSLGPRARTINGGSPPTARKARTGELTPPGKSFSARSCRSRDFRMRSFWDGFEVKFLPDSDDAQRFSYETSFIAANATECRRVPSGEIRG